MKLIVAGSRTFTDYQLLKSVLANIKTPITEIVCGMAKGADLLGYKYAKENNILIAEFPAEWARYGKSAGYIRNEEMAKYADACIAFWDGKSRGTKHMIDLCQKYNIKCKVVMYKEN